MSDKQRFFIRFLFIYNVYGNLFFLLSIVSGILLWFVGHSGLQVFLKWGLLFILIVALLASLFEAVLITSGFKRKLKFYRVTKQRLRKHGFHEEYFRVGMYEPCMRILSKDLLKRIGRPDAYSLLKEKYGNKNQEIEMTKEHLARKLGLPEGSDIEFEEG